MGSTRRLSPFFVVGSGRSGTTMFRLMLNAHGRLHVPRETWFLTDVMNEFAPEARLEPEDVVRVIEVITTHERWKQFGVPTDALLARCASLDHPSLRQVAASVYELSAEAAGKPRWGDKTPGYFAEIPRLARLFPDAQFIHVIRDARDVCGSFYRLGWKGRRLSRIAQFWSDSVTTARSQGRELGPDRYFEIAYEDLVLDSRSTLQATTDFLGEDFDERMLTFYKDADRHIVPGATYPAKTTRPPRASDIGRWRSELATMHVAIIETIAGPTMDAVGQVRQFRGPLRIVPWALRRGRSLAHRSLALRKRLGLHLPDQVKERMGLASRPPAKPKQSPPAA
jgi:hypothetical protein